MNLNKYKWMAVLPMVFTACQQEALVEELPMDSALSTITCSIGGEQADSRAQIVLGNKNREQEIFHWNKGDKFTLFQTWKELTEEDGYVSEHNSYNYHIDGEYSDSAPANTAQFSLDGEGISNVEHGWNWIAFYPTRETYSIDTTEDYCKLEISNTMADNTESSWRSYFKTNMYMMSYGTADVLSKGVNFKHLCGIVRITYTNATNTDHELKGIYVDGTLGNMQVYEIHQPALLSDWASSNMHGITFTDKATVAAGESADFYILYFRPQAVDGEIKDMKGIKVDYGVNGTSSMSQTPSQYLGEEFSYNGFQPGLCSWFKITGLDNNRIVWTRDYNPKDDEGQGGQQPGQGDLDEATNRFYEDLNNPSINVIVLNAPIHLSGNVDLGGKTVSLASDFFTKNPGAEAAIIHDGHLSEGFSFVKIMNGKVKGSTTANNKYLFKLSSQSSRIFNLNELEVTAEDNLNAIHILNSRVRVQASSKVTSSGEYALNVDAALNIAWPEVNGAEVYGGIRYGLYLDNNVAPEYKIEVLRKGKIVGTLIVEGEYKDRLQILNEEGDITLKVNPIEDRTHFEYNFLKIAGNGSVKFLNESDTKVTLAMKIDNFEGNVDFEGNFLKQINVGSTQIQKVMNWAQNQDEVRLNLTGDVTLTQTLTSKGLTMLYGSKEVRSGMFTLNLNKHSIKSEMTAPAIEWKNGVLRIESGNIQTTNDAIHVGAVMANETDNGVVVMINAANITSTNGRCVYIHSDESATSGTTYKTADVEVGKESILKGASTGAIALDESQYTIGVNANVMNYGGTISPNFVIKK